MCDPGLAIKKVWPGEGGVNHSDAGSFPVEGTSGKNKNGLRLKTILLEIKDKWK
jgi:hypothetical protein